MELGPRDSLKLRIMTDTLFAELRRRDVECHIIGLETPKCILWSTSNGPGDENQSCRWGARIDLLQKGRLGGSVR